MHPKVKKVKNLRFAVLATDIALFTLRGDQLLVRLIPVQRPPHYPKNQGLPGGLIRPDETAEQAAQRLLRERGGIQSQSVYLEQLATFSQINRDPRGRVVAVAYLGVVPWTALSANEQADAELYWADARTTKQLAYDHDDMLSIARAQLAIRATSTTLLQKMMPNAFTLTELERAYRIITGRDTDKRNFRKRVEKLGILQPLNSTRRGLRARPAQLYTFADSNVRTLEAL